tara:strand:+ start:800 stop:1084 length:285 start_codon:yes stop_codon:yes gene_type:complete
MKSKKKKTNKYNSQEQEQDIKRATDLVKESITEDTEFIVTPTPRKMINRREVQAEIDKDKQIRSMLASGHYNDNQIASMLRGVNLERVKEIKNG